MQASTSWDDVAFSSTEGDRHLRIRSVSQLTTATWVNLDQNARSAQCPLLPRSRQPTERSYKPWRALRRGAQAAFGLCLLSVRSIAIVAIIGSPP
jgi:hypothetical protein